MIKYSLLLLMAFSPILTLADDGDIQRRRNLPKFHLLSVSQGLKVSYTPSVTEKPHITMEGPKRIMDKISISINDDSFFLSFEGMNSSYADEVDIKLVAPPLDLISISSGAGLEVAAPFTLEGTLNLSVSGVDSEFEADIIEVGQAVLRCSATANIEISDIKATTLTLSASSAAEMDISNAITSTTNISASSGSEVTIKDLAASSLCVITSSGADATVSNATSTTVTLSSSSSSTMDIRGKTEICNVSASSSATVDISQMTISSSGTFLASSSGEILAPKTPKLTISETSGGSVSIEY